jgi:hypothetical protein
MKTVLHFHLSLVARALAAAVALLSIARADTWTVESGQRGGSGVTSTCTVQLPDGTFRQYHNETYRSTTDGLSFSAFSGLPGISAPSGFLTANAAVVSDSQGWVMITERNESSTSTIAGFFRATSTDGITWTPDSAAVMTPNADEAGFTSVPELFIVDATTWRIYYVMGGDVVASATTTDRGKTWTREGKITVVGLENRRFVDPEIIRTPAGHLRMFLSVVPARITTGIGNQSLMAAVSTDGRTFYLETDTLLAPTGTAQTLLDPDVVPSPSGGYRVYYGISGGVGTGPPFLYSATTPALGTHAMTSASSATGTAETAFSFTLTGTHSPNYFVVASGSLPAGLSLNPATGVISGTPTTPGTNTLTVTAANSYATSTAQTVTLTIAGSAHLSNLSIRANVTAGEKVIVGFYVTGGAKSVLIRGIGPGLAPFLSGALAGNPTLDLYNSAGTRIDGNDDWGGGTTLATAFSSVGAFGLPSASTDAALVKSLDGSYSAHFTATSTGVGLIELYDTGSGSTQRLTNVSALYQAGTGGGVLIAGINISGSGSKNILIRGIGPALTPFGVAGALINPQIEVFDSAQKSIATNDDWLPSLATTFSQVGAFALTANSKDAAVVLPLTAGSYTVQLSGVANTTGVALIELYEAP